MFGDQVPAYPSLGRPRTDVIGEVFRTPAGNVAIGVGMPDEDSPEGWYKLAHVCLLPDEARALAAALLLAASPGPGQQ